MLRKQKIQLCNQLTKLIKNSRGYYGVITEAKGDSIQQYYRECRTHGITVKKVKNTLLQRILNIKRGILKRSMYLCIMSQPIPLESIYELNLRYKHYTNYKLGDMVLEDYKVLAKTTTLRPTTLYKQVETILPTKLNRGFIEIVEDRILIMTNEKVTSSQLAAIKELKLTLKPINYDINLLKLDKSQNLLVHTDAYFKDQRLVDYYHSRLCSYIELDNGSMSYLDIQDQLQTLTIDKYKDIQKYIPLEDGKLIQLIAYAPAKLIEYCGLPIVPVKYRANITTLLYILYLFFYFKKYSTPGLSQLFFNEFKPLVKLHYNISNSASEQLYNLFIKIHDQLSSVESTKVETTSKTNVQQQEFDDLF